MKNFAGNLLVGAVALMILLSLSMFVVDQRQDAIVFQMGEINSVKTSPGLYFKLPLVQSVRYFDKRNQTLDTGEPERFITSEKKNLMVDAFVKWRIDDVKQYYLSVGGDEARARTRLLQTINAAMREQFGKRTIHEVISGQRDQIMQVLRDTTNTDAQNIGVQVLDVRLKRVDFPTEISDSVYRRMEAERKRAAN
jgi:modulator of FtsH protease HflC